MTFFDKIFGDKPKVFQQRKWTDEQLKAQGFQCYRPQKRITMARMLPAAESPKIIKTSYDTIVARTGHYIAYVPGDTLKHSLDDYDPRPIEQRVFMETYRPWNEPNWIPSATEKHLMALGCKPYYKVAGVWAKKLQEPTYVQSIESSKPALAPAGSWLCVGTVGEPWVVTDEWFKDRYILPGSGEHGPARVR